MDLQIWFSHPIFPQTLLTSCWTPKTPQNTNEIITLCFEIALWGLVISKLQRTRGFLLVKCLDCISVTKSFEFFQISFNKVFLCTIFVLLAMLQTDFIETHVCSLWEYSNSNRSTLILKVYISLILVCKIRIVKRLLDYIILKYIWRYGDKRLYEQKI